MDVQKVLLAPEISAVALTSFFLLFGLFLLALFLFERKKNYFLALALFTLATGVRYALQNGAFFWRIEAASPFLSPDGLRPAIIAIQCAALVFFFRALYKDRLRLALALPFYAISLLLAAAGLILPTSLPALGLAVELYCALLYLAALAFLAIVLAKGDTGARTLAPATLVAASGLALARLAPESVWLSGLAPQAAWALFCAAAALMLMKRMADSYETAQVLTDYVASYARTVQRFIPKEFLEHLHKAELTDLRLGDHAKKEMTIFFSDIRAFTELSEGLTVEENFAFINSYLSRVVPVIRDNGGFVDKYVGDGIMALFAGAQGPDDAIRSAIALQGKMVEYNGHRAKMGYRPISTGIGIHTGDLMLGVVGVDERMENTVISDAVNLSSRLQSITKAFNISLAISEQAFKELEDPGIYKYRFIGKVKVKGKAAPVSVFEIFDGIAPELFERKMKANMFFEQGMLSYYQKEFGDAMYYFKRVLEIIPEDGASSFYLENCMNKAAR